MIVMVNSQNVRSYRCLNCSDSVNFDYADDLMKKYQLCNKCLDEKIRLEGNDGL
jgi:DNA-directed RNA polymerase subunit RPC12/RpoP